VPGPQLPATRCPSSPTRGRPEAVLRCVDRYRDRYSGCRLISTRHPTARAYFSIVLNDGRVWRPLSRRQTVLLVVHIRVATSRCESPVRRRAATSAATSCCNVPSLAKFRGLRLACASTSSLLASCSDGEFAFGVMGQPRVEMVSKNANHSPERPPSSFRTRAVVPRCLRTVTCGCMSHWAMEYAAFERIRTRNHEGPRIRRAFPRRPTPATVDGCRDPTAGAAAPRARSARAGAPRRRRRPVPRDRPRPARSRSSRARPS
jgi:hypothetical protein